MPKFYLQSGQIEIVVTAADAEAAALWLMEQTVNRNLPANTQAHQISEGQHLCLAVEAIDEMADEIRVSEVGLGRDEAGCFPTELIFHEWFTLVHALNSLLGQLED